MTDTKFTMDQTLVWLRRAVAERGNDFDYCKTYKRGKQSGENPFGTSNADNCRYVEGIDGGIPEPGCIAGHVFHQAGVSLEDLVKHEYTSAGVAAPKLGFTKPASEMLHLAQRIQDRGGSWGEALTAAETWARGFNAARDLTQRAAWDFGRQATTEIQKALAAA